MLPSAVSTSDGITGSSKYDYDENSTLFAGPTQNGGWPKKLRHKFPIRPDQDEIVAHGRYFFYRHSRRALTDGKNGDHRNDTHDK
jgi:hypothetical protein